MAYLNNSYELFKLIAAGAEQSLGVFNTEEAITEQVRMAVTDRWMLIARHPERVNPLGRKDESYATASKGPRGKYFVMAESDDDSASGLWLDEIKAVFRGAIKVVEEQ